ncbi:hypothetical protein D3C71_1585870 [compost metagenome]
MHASIKWICSKPVKGHIAVKLKGLSLFQDFTVCHVFEGSEISARLQAFLENATQVFYRGQVVQKLLILDVFDVRHIQSP